MIPPNQGLQPQAWTQRFDQLPPSPPSSRETVAGQALNDQEASDLSLNTSGERRAEKAPHDASVFVGSLPSNIDHLELTRMLTDHLSEHIQVKNIKVVRDSKGGVCAFVQCEDAQSANTLIETLRSVTPKPFLGRILRFEPARAFRTLLVSYRAPSYILPGYVTPQIHDPSELPFAMRIWKPQASRFHHIAYNTEAIAAESQGQDCGNTESSLYLHPLTFDEATIVKMAAYFGAVEKLELYQSEIRQEDDATPRSPTAWKEPSTPHTAPRLPCMDPHCWEIKWDHRDDCVGALVAMRRIPHLTVTWAHQPHSPGSDFYNLPRVNQLRHPVQPSPFLPGLPFSSTAPPLSQTVRDDGSTVNRDALVVGSSQEPSGQSYASKSIGVTTTGKMEIALLSSSKPSNYKSMSMPRDGFEWNDCITKSGVSPTSDVFQGNRNAPTFLSLESRSNASHATSSNSALFLPATPKVPAAAYYPLTPTSWIDEEPQRSALMPKEAPTERNIDPMSIFVGGLDVLGSCPWTEERVRDHFSRYGGLESVKFVRPFDATTAFAFIKFNNTDGPARAVLEEHNRVYEGRLLRVQLRDCNPPRNPWKHGRGRGRFLQNHHVYQGRFDIPHKSIPSTDVPSNNSIGSPVGCSDSNQSTSSAVLGEHSFISEASPTSDDKTLHDTTPSPSLSSSDNPDHKGPASPGPTVQDAPRTYREWYDDLELVSNSASRPNSTPSSTSVSTVPPPAYPYVYPHTPYFPGPPTWIPAHNVYQNPYAIPYYQVYPSHTFGQPGDPTEVGTHSGWCPPGITYPAPYFYPTQTGSFNSSQRMEISAQPGRSANSGPVEGVDQGSLPPHAPLPMCHPSSIGQPQPWGMYGHPYFPPPPNTGSFSQSIGWQNRLAPSQPPAYIPNQIGVRQSGPAVHKRQGNRRDHQPQRHYHSQRAFNGKSLRQGGGGGQQEPGAAAAKGKHHLANRG